MQAVVGIRCSQEGLGWVEAHPRRDVVIQGYIEEFRYAPPPEDVMRHLIALSRDWNKVRTWQLAERHHISLEDLVASEICLDGLVEEHRKILVKIALVTSASKGQELSAWIPLVEMKPSRRIELVFDIMTTHLDSSTATERGADFLRASAQSLAQALSASEANLANALIPVLASEAVSGPASTLSADGRSLMLSVLADCGTDLGGPLLFLATAAGEQCDEVIRRLLATDDAAEALTVTQSLAMRADDQALALLGEALRHSRYKVRRKAMNLLLIEGRRQDQSSILEMFRDRSADVRLAWANAMQEQVWPEAVEGLIELLQDTRNFNARPAYMAGPSWAKYEVARAAAQALGAYEPVPSSAFEALLQAASNRDCDDPIVACRALSAVYRFPDSRVDRLIFQAFRSPGLVTAPTFRPLAQSAVTDRRNGATDVRRNGASNRWVKRRPEGVKTGSILQPFEGRI